jgi:hypothetical protein
VPGLALAHRRRATVVAASVVAVSVVGAALAAGSPVAPDADADSTYLTGTRAAASRHVDRSAKDVTRTSWNRHVHCKAHLTTLRILLGKDRNANGGATHRGGGFKPGIPDKRSFHPPCRVHNHPTFVQLNRVQVGDCKKINDDGDWTCGLTDPTTPARRSIHMKSIHIETDKKFRKHSGWSRPPAGTDIRVQGFVYWDPGHTSAEWHHFTGWELHSFTAWRKARS